MKIAIDVRDADGQKTGKGFYAFGLIKNILEQDQENQYILYSDQAKSPFPAQENVTFKHVDKTGIKWHFATLSDLKKERPDLYFAPTSYIIPAMAPRWLKVILTVHDLVAFMFPKNHKKKAVLIERFTLKHALKNSSKIFVVSENTKNDLINRFHLPKSMMAEVPCAPNELYRNEFDQKQAEHISKKYKLPKHFILGVGTLEPRKNFATLIKSYVIIKRRFPDYKLVIVGKCGWRFHQLQRLVQEYKMEDDVLFLGYVRDHELHYIYHSAEVFVFPSLYEGFGIPPLEAMASGCPVVSSNTSSLPEVVGDAGLLIEPRNSVKIADAIISILENPNVRNMLIERGFKRSQHFNWAHSARLALQAFEEQKPT